jgi:hypothetical protein
MVLQSLLWNNHLIWKILNYSEIKPRIINFHEMSSGRMLLLTLYKPLNHSRTRLQTTIENCLQYKMFLLREIPLTIKTSNSRTKINTLHHYKSSLTTNYRKVSSLITKGLGSMNILGFLNILDPKIMRVGTMIISLKLKVESNFSH